MSTLALVSVPCGPQVQTVALRMSTDFGAASGPREALGGWARRCFWSAVSSAFFFSASAFFVSLASAFGSAGLAGIAFTMAGFGGCVSKTTPSIHTCFTFASASK